MRLCRTAQQRRGEHRGLAGDLCGHGEPSYRTALSHTLLQDFPPTVVYPITHTGFSNVPSSTLQARPRVFKPIPIPPWSDREPYAGWGGIAFAQPLNMGRICQHCDAPFVDSPYRVISEESGIVLLDLIVCHRCHEQAQKLGLRTEEIKGSAPSERLPGH